MMDATLQLVALSASLVVLVRAEPALNRMTRITHLTVRLALHLLLLGAVAQIGAIALGHVPELPVVILSVGIALLLICDRRMRAIERRSRRHPPSRHAGEGG